MRILIVCLCAATLLAQRKPLEFDITWVNPPAAPVKGVEHKRLESKAMGREVGYNVYLPPDYATSGRRYPVIYWMHGAGGNESSNLWVAEEFDRAVQAGQVEPAIMVFANGGRRSEYRDWREQNVQPESMIIRELIPHIDATYRTVATPQARHLEGMSMGANGSLKLALKYPEMFHSVVAYAGSYKRLPLDGYFSGIAQAQQDWVAKLAQWYSADDDVFELAHRNSARLGHLRIRLVIGTKDVAFPDSEALHPWLKDRGIPHEYEIVLGVAHDAKAYYQRSGWHGFRFHFAR